MVQPTADLSPCLWARLFLGCKSLEVVGRHAVQPSSLHAHCDLTYTTPHYVSPCSAVVAPPELKNRQAGNRLARPTLICPNALLLVPTPLSASPLCSRVAIISWATPFNLFKLQDYSWKDGGFSHGRTGNIYSLFSSWNEPAGAAWVSVSTGVFLYGS